MAWWLAIGLSAGLIAVFVVVTLVLRVTGGHAPGWRVRCTRCGRTRDAAKVGIVRIGAASAGKRTVGWCSACRRLRVIAIERATTT